MNYEKYYRKEMDGFSVHFLNKNGLTDDQIKEIFTCFGDIVSLYSSPKNPIFGFKFIKYRTLEDIQKCLKQLQNNTYDISILPQKQVNKKTDLISVQSQIKRNDSKETSSTNQQFNLNSFHGKASSSDEEKHVTHRKKFSQKKSESIDWFENTSSVSSRQNYKSTDNAGKFDRQQNCEEFILSNCDRATEKEDIKSQQQCNVDMLTCENTFDISTIPALISDLEIKSKISDTIPKRLEETVTVYEVLVANIHVKYGVHYILHLFEKYDPIAATLVETVPKTSIRYCYVYFKTLTEASAVVKEFDNFILFDQKLIVLRKAQLMQEIMRK